MDRSRLATLKKIIWIVCLAVALVFTQGVQLHLHTYSHDPVTPTHEHQAQAHFDHDTLGHGHADDLGQVDLSQEGFLKKLSQSTLVFAVLFAVILLVPGSLCSKVFWRLYRNTPLPAAAFVLRPPLRAPPL
ncbi:MAG: hypothetical protein AB1810_15315 [Pseudomonadota bacterium]